MSDQNSQNQREPGSLIAAKRVDLALISYVDSSGVTQTQLAVVGAKNVHLLEARAMGMSNTTTPQGVASEWLTKAVLKAMEGQ